MIERINITWVRSLSALIPNVTGWEAGSMRWVNDGSILSIRMRSDGKMVKLADLLALSIQTNLKTKRNNEFTINENNHRN